MADHIHCAHCDYTTTKKANLRSHHTIRHVNGIQPREMKPLNNLFSCPLCEYIGRTCLGYKKHFTTKHTDKMYYCAEEGCDFESINYLKLCEHSKKKNHSEFRQEYIE